jgi:multiple sugar transport system permease protein
MNRGIPTRRRLHTGPYGRHRETPLERIRALGWHGLAFMMAAIFLLPLVAMFVGSLRAPGLPPPVGIEWLPNPVTWNNYAEVFRLVDMGRYMLNSLVVAAMAVPTTLLVASWAGFALALLPRLLARRVIVASLLFLLLPEISLWVSRFILYKFVGIIDTPFALAAPSLLGTSPLYMLVFYWTFRRVPLDTWEAARLDGAGAFRMWWSIGVPAARAAFGAVGVLSFVYYWREFREPLLYIQDISKYTASIGLSYLEQLDRTNLPILLAGSVIVTLPLVIVFLLAQRFFLEPWERVSTGRERATSDQ